MAEQRERPLYRYGAEKEERAAFERRYGKKHGDYVYGAVVGKVKRERSHAHRHSRGHHRGPCDGSCRSAHRAHSHSR